MPMIPNDWIELFALTVRYSHALDTRDYALLRGCFADPVHVTYDGFSAAGDLLNFHDAATVADQAERIHTPLLLTMHRNSNQSFEIDGDHATGRVYVDVFQVRVGDRESPETVHHIGWYDDVFLRTPDGWRFTERHYLNKWSEGSWLGAPAEAVGGGG